MTFEEIVDQALAMLQRRGRVGYRLLKLQFQLDDEQLEALTDELLYAYPQMVEDDGRGLVYTGEPRQPPTPGSPLATDQERAPLFSTPAHLTEKILDARQALAGERKQVTVLFADLKGSMELLADRDPEDARQLLDLVLERMIEAVHRYEGTVNQVMGDGIMALFGAPIAHEDHAVRACYAALRMQEAVTRYGDELQRSHGVPVQIRVGLNSGEVVVRAIDSSLHMDYTAVGQTTHLAARMEQMAKPGSMLIMAETLRLAEESVQVRPLGPVPVKGLAHPVEVFELTGALSSRTRLQAVAARGLTRFVGRQAELAALRQALDWTAAGHGQVVAVIGEPGVGKTRLFWEFTHAHRPPGWLLLDSHSASYGQATPYLPVRDLLQGYFEIDARDAARRIREKVTGKLLTLDAALGPALPAVLTLLDVPVDDPAWHALDPSQRRQRTLDALKRLLLRESQAQPLLLVFENLHWIDAETQALLDTLAESLPTARILLLVNYRPEYTHRWGGKTYYTQLRLDPLPPARAEELLQVLLGDDPGLTLLKQRLVERTEGNPFFLEESVHTLAETGVLEGERGAYHLVQARPTIRMPATVQAVLAARIDRLPPAEKRLLQTAAVIGTEVPMLLLQAIAELPEDALHRGLAHLQATEFLYETRLYPEREYTFKHALTYEVAYRSLLQERRRVLHARIVEALEVLAADRLAEQVEELAHHALRGEVWEKAVAYGRQAGAKAFARSANREAVAYFEQALGALAHVPERRDTREQAIDLRIDLRNALSQFRDERRIFTCLREAEALAQGLHDQRRLGQVSAYLSSSLCYVGDHGRAIAYGQRALSIAEALGDFALQVVTRFHLGQAYLYHGEYRQAIDCLRWNIESLPGDLLQARLGMAGVPAVVSRAPLAIALAERGEFTEGRTRGEEGLRIAEAVDHPASLIAICQGLGQLYLHKGDLQRAIALLERGLGLARTWTILTRLQGLTAALGSAYALSGRLTEALPLLEEALVWVDSRQIRVHHARLIVGLSRANLFAGQLEEAHALAEHALALACEHQERGNRAYALHLLGDIAARRNPPEVESAEAYYRQALARTGELGMRPLQAHGHLGLGTLYAMTGQREQAHAQLLTALELYRAMDMTFWLLQAEAALAQVEGH